MAAGAGEEAETGAEGPDAVEAAGVVEAAGAGAGGVVEVATGAVTAAEAACVAVLRFATMVSILSAAACTEASSSPVTPFLICVTSAESSAVAAETAPAISETAVLRASNPDMMIS